MTGGGVAITSSRPPKAKAPARPVSPLQLIPKNSKDIFVLLRHACRKHFSKSNRMPQAELILRIYDAALQPALWPAILQDIAKEAGAFGAMIFDRELNDRNESVSLRYLSEVYDPDLLRWYVATYNSFEVDDQARFAQLSSSGNEINLIRCDDLYSSRAVLEARPNVERMMDFGVQFRAGALLAKDTTAMDRFALQFTGAQGPISEAARLYVSSLLPHVAKALSIGRAFQKADEDHRTLEIVLQALPFGLGILRHDGTLIQSNAEFRELCSEYRLLSPHTQRVAIDCLPAALQRLFASASAHGQFGARPLREAAFIQSSDEGVGVFLEIGPISGHPDLERFGEDTYLVSMLDSRRTHKINAEIVRRFFPISESESQVLDLVVKGYTNTEIAEIRGRALETVNTQMKALIRKSGTRNRTELVRVAVGLSVASLQSPKLD